MFLMTLGKKFETNLELVLFFVIPKNILSWAEKMFQVRNFFFNVHIKSRSSEYISDIFVRFGVIGNSQKIWVVRNSKCSTNSYLDGSFDVVHHLDRASLLC